MGTLHQKQVARIIVEATKNNERISAQEILTRADYAPQTARAESKRVLESVGVREELEALGFTIENADRVVTRILNKGRKEENQLKAGDMIYKRLGAYSPEKRAVVVINIDEQTKNRLDNLLSDAQ